MSRIDPQDHFLAGNSNLHRAPLQAQLHVMRNSFNRGRPEAEQAGYPQAHPSGPSSFPPSGLTHGQEHHRGFAAPNHEFGAVPRVASASKQPVMPISSSTLSSLPPSVAAFYELEQRQQQQQMTGRGSAINRHLNGVKYSHRQQISWQSAQQPGQTFTPSTDANLAHYLQTSGRSAAGELSLPTGIFCMSCTWCLPAQNAVMFIISLHSHYMG